MTANPVKMGWKALAYSAQNSSHFAQRRDAPTFLETLAKPAPSLERNARPERRSALPPSPHSGAIALKPLPSRTVDADEDMVDDVEVPNIIRDVRFPNPIRVHDGGFRWDNLQKKFAAASHVGRAIEDALAKAANQSVKNKADVNKTSSKTGDPDNIPGIFYKTRAGQAYILWRRLAGVNCGGLFLNFHRKRMSRGLTKQQREMFEKLMEHLRTSITPTQEARHRTRSKMFRSSMPGADRIRSWELSGLAYRKGWGGGANANHASAAEQKPPGDGAKSAETDRRCQSAG